MLETYVTKQSAKKKLSTPHEGQLLANLVSWTGLSKTDFSSQFGNTTEWLRKASKLKEIRPELKLTLKSKFNVPMEYWTGTFELPPFKTLNPDFSLKQKNISEADWKRQNEEKDALIIQLQNELLRLYREKNN